jgi:hypothetical protein
LSPTVIDRRVSFEQKLPVKRQLALFGLTARKLFPPVFGYKKWKRKLIILVREKDVEYCRGDTRVK